jgi:hypothetical protein
MAVDIDTRTSFHAGTPHPLFKLPSQSFGPDEKSWGCDTAGENFFLVVPPKVLGAVKVEVVSDFNSLVSRK